MRAIAIIVILAVAGFFGYQYAVEGRGPGAARQTGSRAGARGGAVGGADR